MKNSLKTLRDSVVRNPKTTAAGLAALLGLMFPAYKGQICTIAIALVGLLSKDVQLELPNPEDLAKK